MTHATTRRRFLKAAGATGATLLIGIRPDGALAATTDATQLNPFVRIGPDGTVTAIVKHF
ncbi:twin-arginine translocation signal domain-containing protein, partial [Roseobacter sp.]|uniref:twin-arginine translocation signal domain-containing protein n=1 Tax=Roseobacter sp. TaxID=1907202 RepID=UPI0025D1C6A2